MNDINITNVLIPILFVYFILFLLILLYTKNNNYENIFLFISLITIIFIFFNIIVFKNIILNEIFHVGYVLLLFISIFPQIKNIYILGTIILISIINILIFIYLGKCPLGHFICIKYLPLFFKKILLTLTESNLFSSLLQLFIIIVNLMKIFYNQNIKNGTTTGSK